MKILFVDTETGGLDPQKHSLLSIGAVWWEDGVLGETFEYQVREPVLRVTQAALSINNIDLREHIHPSSLEETKRSFVRYIEGGLNERIILGGHNIAFDVGFLKEFFRSMNVRFSVYFQHQTVDTASCAFMLKALGLLDIPKISSSTLFEYYGITFPEGHRHTALGDAIATAKLFTVMLAHFRIKELE